MSVDLKSLGKVDLEKLWERLSARDGLMGRRLPHWLARLIVLIGLVLILIATLLYIEQKRVQDRYEALNTVALSIHRQGERVIRHYLELLRSPEFIQSGRDQVLKKISHQELMQRLREKDEDVFDARTFSVDLLSLPIDKLGGAIYPQNYVLFDMLLEAEGKGVSSLQMLYDQGRDMLAGVTRLTSKDGDVGYLLVSWKADSLFDLVSRAGKIPGFLSLQQAAGATHFSNLKSIGNAPESWVGARRQPLRGSLFYISWSQPPLAGFASIRGAFLFALLGLLVMAIGWLRRPLPETGAVAESEPVLVADETPVPDDEKNAAILIQEQAAMAEFNARQLGAESPPPGQEPKPPAGKAPSLPFEPPEPLPEVISSRERIKPPQSIFKAYDIRGVVNDTLSEDGAWFIGRALGTLAVRQQADPVVIGRDGRVSGPALSKALKQGLLASGCDVIEVGMVPTGVLYFAAAEFGSGSGVVVTGSHNPPDYNGLKMVIGGKTLASEDIQNLYRMIVAEDFEEGVGVTRSEGVLSRYQERIAEDIRLARPLKVVIDCGNGVGGVNAVSVLQAIGAEVSALYDDVDGNFPNHHPDPSVPENLQDLIKAVKGTHADLGLALDGDADRLGVVTPSGEIIYSDRLMILLVRDILSRNPGATIIYDVKCSRHLTTAIRDAGGVPLMWKTGHSLIKNKMRDMKSPFAGEMSGHFFFKERWYGVDDGIYAACRLLEILAWRSESPEEVLEALPKGVSTPEIQIPMREGENHAFIDLLQGHARFDNAEINIIDGLRVDFADGWGLVRASNTTPILVARFDADSEESLQHIKNAFRDLLLSLKPDLELPF